MILLRVECGEIYWDLGEDLWKLPELRDQSGASLLDKKYPRVQVCRTQGLVFRLHELNTQPDIL